jgi:hypothetical protein
MAIPVAHAQVDPRLVDGWKPNQDGGPLQSAKEYAQNWFSPSENTAAPQGDNTAAQPDPAAQAEAGKAEFLAKFDEMAQRGDGNAMAYALADAVKRGILTKEEAKEMGSQIQQIANQNGGGKINGDARAALKEALGEDVIAHGKTRGEMKFINFFKGLGDFLRSLFGL